MSRITDDLYLACHDERTGRCRVTQRSGGLGLAAAMLADLVLTEHVHVCAGFLLLGPAQEPPSNRMLAEVLELLALRPRDRDVAAWLRFLGLEAAEDVRQQLLSERVLTRVATRTVTRRRRVMHVPMDPNAAVWPTVRLAKHLSLGLPMSLQDKILTSLVQVVGLLDTVLWCRPDHDPGWERARVVRRELPDGLAELVAHAEATVGQGVLAGRRV